MHKVVFVLQRVSNRLNETLQFNGLWIKYLCEPKYESTSIFLFIIAILCQFLSLNYLFQHFLMLNNDFPTRENENNNVLGWITHCTLNKVEVNPRMKKRAIKPCDLKLIITTFSCASKTSIQLNTQHTQNQYLVVWLQFSFT